MLWNQCDAIIDTSANPGYGSSMGTAWNHSRRRTPLPIQRIDEALERKQIERVRSLRERRDRLSWQEGIILAS